jgi:hypothetical protein
MGTAGGDGGGTVPLYHKLGIGEHAVVVLKAAPPGFEDELAGRPPTSVVSRRAVKGRTLTVWFVAAVRALDAGIDAVVADSGTGSLWICWPRRSAPVDTDISFDDVQRAGLERGLVDHKICAIDETWTALRFARRKEGKYQVGTPGAPCYAEQSISTTSPAAWSVANRKPWPA